MTSIPISYGEYADALSRLGREGQNALSELEQAHHALRDALFALYTARAPAYSDERVLAAKAAGERDALVDLIIAREKVDVKEAEMRIDAAHAALREVRSRRQSGDELARQARRQMELDTPGPDVAILARRAA